MFYTLVAFMCSSSAPPQNLGVSCLQVPHPTLIITVGKDQVIRPESFAHMDGLVGRKYMEDLIKDGFLQKYLQKVATLPGYWDKWQLAIDKKDSIHWKLVGLGLVKYCCFVIMVFLVSQYLVFLVFMQGGQGAFQIETAAKECVSLST